MRIKDLNINKLIKIYAYLNFTLHCELCENSKKSKPIYH